MQTSLDSGFRLDAICVRYLNTCSLTLVPVMDSNMPDSSFCPTSNPGRSRIPTLFAFQLHQVFIRSREWRVGEVKRELEKEAVVGESLERSGDATERSEGRGGTERSRDGADAGRLVE